MSAARGPAGIGLFVILAATCLVPPASAGPAETLKAAAAPEAAMTAEQRQERLLEALRGDLAPAFRSAQDGGARRANIRALIHKRFDLDRIAATTLGEFWTAAGIDERAGFRVVLSDHIAKMIERMLGSAAVEVESAGRVREDNGMYYAMLTLRSPTSRTPCVFVLNGEADGRVTDVFIYGISLVMVKQAEFRSILLRDGFRGLMAALAE